MASKAAFELSRAQQSELNKMPLTLLIAFDEAKRWPVTHAISWVQAIDLSTIRFALTQKSHLFTLLQTEKTVSLIFYEDKLIYSVTLSNVHTFTPASRPELSLHYYEGHVEEVRNISFYGAEFRAPEIEKTYDIQAAEKLDREVKASLNS